jgi:uncharacterized delta-60 repeat protein
MGMRQPSGIYTVSGFFLYLLPHPRLLKTSLRAQRSNLFNHKIAALHFVPLAMTLRLRRGRKTNNMKHLLIIASLFIGFVAKAQPGALDLSFDPGAGANNIIRTIALQADGKIVIGGDFNTYNGTAAGRIARLHPDGSVDTTFNTGLGTDHPVYKVLVQPDGKIIAAGDFSYVDSVSSERIVRLNTDGSIDTTFVVGIGFNAQVYALALQPDGKIIAGGDFTSYNGSSCSRLVRLNTNGSYDSTFNTILGTDRGIGALTIQPDGRILIGGDFTTYDGVLNWRIARANPDGSRDIMFADTMGASRVVNAIAVRPNGSILLGGNFVQFNFQPRNRIAQLDSNGLLEQLFNGPGADAPVRDIIIHNGTILIVGDFSTYENMTYKGLVKTDMNYSIDNTFNIGTGVNHSINDAEINADGKIFISGGFTQYNGINRKYIARLYNCLTTQPDSIYGLNYAECIGTPQTYYVPPVPGALKYEWTLPNGWFGTSDSAFITAISGGSGGVISVKAFSAKCGYSYAETRTIATVQPPGVDICLVTVNDSSTHNIILWEKPATTLIDSFFIYRETTTNVYTKIGATAYDSLSQFHDYAANPNATSYRYKLSVRDTCGAESALSPYHRTIHLQHLGNGNFQWTFYQIETASNPVNSFNMNRDPFDNGNFFPIGLIPGTNATFTDLNASSFPDAVYVIDVNWNISCTPTRTVNTTRSNIRRPSAIDTTWVNIEPVLEETLRIYPNPAGEKVHIMLPQIKGNHHLQLFNSLGQIVWQKHQEHSEETIDVRLLPKGIYLLAVETEAGLWRKKIVMQ